MSLQEQLYEWFMLDQQSRGLRVRLDAAKVKLKERQVALDRLRRQRDELQSQFKLDQAKAANLENDVRSMEEKIDQLRQQMNNVRNNKEYSAVLVEVNTLKGEKNKIEEQALEQLNTVDRVKGQLQELEKKCGEMEGLVTQASQEVAVSGEEVSPRLKELTAKQAAVEEGLPAETRAFFGRLLEDHEGDAMAVVVEGNRRAMEYTCGGCYLGIPVERVNALMVQRDQIVICPNCGRVLYLDEELKGSIGSKA